jgi:hypothetical protein
MRAEIDFATVLRSRSLLFLLAVVVALYSAGLSGEFVIDDHTYFVENDILPYLRPWDFANIFLHPSNYWGELLPLRDLGFVCQYRLFGDNPFGYHLISLLLYLMVVVVAWRLIVSVSGASSAQERFTSLFALGFFALHPLHVESVSYISGQKDLLCALFSFVAIHQALRFLDRDVHAGRGLSIGLFVAAYYAAFLSKSFAVATGLLVTLCGINTLWVNPSRRWRVFWGWVAINLPVIFWLRYNMVVATEVMGGTSPLPSLPIAGILLRAVRILGEHYLLVFWPFRLNFGYPFDPLGGYDAAFWVGLVGTLALCMVLVCSRDRCLRFGVLLVFCYLLPVTQIFMSFQNAGVYDRYLFVPILGFGLLIGRALFWLNDTLSLRWVAKGVAVLILVVLGGLTFRYVPVYHSNISVTEHAYNLFPDWSGSSFNLVTELIENGEYARARQMLQQETGLRQPAWVPGFLSGWILLEENRLSEAEAPLQTSFWLAANGGYFPYAALPLARLYRAQGKTSAALSVLDPLLRRPPWSNPVVYFRAKELQSAMVDR